MRYAELVSRVAATADLSHADVRAVIEAVSDELGRFKPNDKVKLPFGTVRGHFVKARKFTNPRTGAVQEKESRVELRLKETLYEGDAAE